MNYGETGTPAEWCILNSEICPLSLSWLGEDCEIMIQNSFHLTMPQLSHTYISHVLQQDLELRKIRRVVGHGGKLQAAIRRLLYTSPAVLFNVPLPAPGPSFSHLISCSPFLAMACSNTSILFPSIFLTRPPSLPPTKPFLPPCLSFSREVSTISLATAGWGVLSSQVQGDGRLGRLASAHSVFTLRYSLPVNTKLHWTWGV